MTTFVLSQQDTTWQIYRFNEGISEIAAGIPDEKRALAIVMGEARKNVPSQVLCVSSNGETCTLARFE